MAKLPKLIYKFIGKHGARKFLRRPQIRYTDWQRLDDVMEAMPGIRHLTDREVDAAAKIEARLRPGVPLHVCRSIIEDIRTEQDPMEYARLLRESFERQPSTLFISSMTARWDSCAMWALYGDEHRGIVFGVRNETVKRIIQQRPGAVAHRVKYSKHRPKIAIRTMTDDDRANRNLAPITKSHEWKYQSEIRIIKGTGETDFLPWIEVSEIIVGCRASDDLLQLAREKSSNGRVPVYRAYPHPSDYRMERQKVE